MAETAGDESANEPANRQDASSEGERGDGEGITDKVKHAADAAAKIPSAIKEAAAPVADSAVRRGEEIGTSVKEAAARSPLRSKKVLIPVAVGTATAAGALVAKRVSDARQPGAEGAGVAGDAVAGAKDLIARTLHRVTGDGAREDGSGRSLPIQCSIDVAVPVDAAYERWTEFRDFRAFPPGADAGAKVTEQTPNERIAWRSEDGGSGAITFHSLSDRLTRIEVTVDGPSRGALDGLLQRLPLRTRAAAGDLKLFKAAVEKPDTDSEPKQGDAPANAGGDAEAEGTTGATQAAKSPRDLAEGLKEREARRARRRQSQAA